MIINHSLAWQPVGDSWLASALLNFSTDLIWQVALAGSYASEYVQARSVDINALLLPAGGRLTISFNGVSHVIPTGRFQSFNLDAGQGYLLATYAGTLPASSLLSFFPMTRAEFR